MGLDLRVAMKHPINMMFVRMDSKKPHDSNWTSVMEKRRQSTAGIGIQLNIGCNQRKIPTPLGKILYNNIQHV